MFSRYRIYLVSFFVLYTATLFGQDDSNRVGVVMVSKYSENSIWLRWAPTTPMAWEKANANGWWVERVLIPTSTEPGDTAYVLLTKNPIKPLPLEHWEQPSDTSNAAAIAAQVLYGETLEITNTSSAMTLMDKNRELESRFAFGLTAAEQDFTVAQMMGLGIVDNNLLPNRTYIYRVYASICDSLFVADTAGVLINLSQRYELPRVFDLKAQVRDTSITLEWPAGYHRGIYSTYRVEKSIEGNPFEATSSLPLANLFSSGQSDFNHFFTDQHSTDGQTLYYRVRGITPFGDVGPPSDSVRVTVPLLFPLPSGLKYTEMPDGNIAVVWEYPDEFINKVSEFEIVGSVAYGGQPKKLGSYAPDARGGLIATPSSELYVAVVAVGNDGTRRNSYPMMVQLADSIPPAPPQNLHGLITKEGTAKVEWQWGTELDLFGYRVYAAINPKAEFTLVSKDFVRDSSYSWSIPLNTLSRRLYVRVMAYDYRYNYSGFSEMLTLTIPDTTPPSAPVLRVCEQTSEGVRFSWVPSSSSDVAAHALIYKSVDGLEQDTIKLFKDKQNSYTWDKPKEGIWNFVVTAIDSSGNSAHSAQHFQLNLKGMGFTNFMPRLAATKNLAKGQVELRWSTHPESVKAIVYRSVNGEQYRIYSTVNSSTFVDSEVTIGNSYAYLVRLENQSDMPSIFSEEVKINY